MTNSDVSKGATRAADLPAAIIADHKAAAAFESIPESYMEQIRGSYRIFYGHTSHGSQIMTGIKMLARESPGLYHSPHFREPGGDLGHRGNTTWARTTRTFLDSSASSEYNVVMWSWCGGASDNTAEGIDAYLNTMDKLEQAYPDRVFIYMTGHTDGSGPARGNNLRANNARIRAYCAEHGKVLFDFEDIESWDPDGNYYPHTSDDCGWCSEWCKSHGCPECDHCAHSHCFNCYLKGKAFWWMMARLAGWDPRSTGSASLSCYADA